MVSDWRQLLVHSHDIKRALKFLLQTYHFVDFGDIGMITSGQDGELVVDFLLFFWGTSGKNLDGTFRTGCEFVSGIASTKTSFSE